MEIAKARIDQWIKKNNIKAILKLNNLNLIECPEIPPNCIYVNLMYNKLTSLPYMKSYEHVDASYNKYLYIKPYQMKTYISHNNLDDFPAKCKYSVNYQIFATKIQQAYRTSRQKRIFVELNKIYIKNMALLISSYC